jgi:hypothetical protein
LKALQNEKPSSSISFWIDRLSAAEFGSMEGIPELVDSINLQSTGPTGEAWHLAEVT